MIKLELYNNNKTYMFPNGQIATPDTIKEQYPAAAIFQHVVQTDERSEVLSGFFNLSMLRGSYNIDNSLPDEDAIKQIEYIMNNPPQSQPSTEERIAAAMEFQNMVALSNLN